MPERSPDPTERPPVSAEMVLIRVAIAAYISTAHMKPRQRARAFLRAASEMLASEESVALVFAIRPSSPDTELRRAQREAVTVFRQYLPVFAAAVPTWEDEG